MDGLKQLHDDRRYCSNCSTDEQRALIPCYGVVEEVAADCPMRTIAGLLIRRNGISGLSNLENERRWRRMIGKVF